MLHVDRDGRLLEAPVALDGVRSPQNSALGPGEEPTLIQHEFVSCERGDCSEQFNKCMAFDYDKLQACGEPESRHAKSKA